MVSKKKTYNILMYSHDTYGLGHIRRTMAIASQLRNSDTNILILTGSPIVGRFVFPQQVDFVRIPGMIKTTNEEYLPLSININADHAIQIRKNIIAATVKTFQPHLFVVDKEPLILKGEVLPAFKWLKKFCPDTRSVLGLRDIMDDAETVKKSWQRKGIYQALDRYYNEIWVYGNQDFYDPVQEYSIPENISRKVHFLGYIPREIKSKKEASRERNRIQVREADTLVVVTAGGGGDGYPVMDAYLSMLERRGAVMPCKSILVTGPFMPKSKRKEIVRRSAKLKVRVFGFYRQMEKLFATADLVIGMGGYNTVCELMSQKTLSLLMPRETPRMEQTLRAQCFQEKKLLDYIPWQNLTNELFDQKVDCLLNAPQKYFDVMSKFEMTFFDNVHERLKRFNKY